MKIDYIGRETDVRGLFLLSLGLRGVHQILAVNTYEQQRIALQHSGHELCYNDGPLVCFKSGKKWDSHPRARTLLRAIEWELTWEQTRQPPSPPFYRDPDCGASNVLDWMKLRRSTSILRPSSNWLHKWAFIMWDDDRLQSNNILRPAFLIDYDTGYEDIAVREIRMDLRRTQQRKTHLWDAGYCGWWSKIDELQTVKRRPRGPPHDPVTGRFISRAQAEAIKLSKLEKQEEPKQAPRRKRLTTSFLKELCAPAPNSSNKRKRL